MPTRKHCVKQSINVVARTPTSTIEALLYGLRRGLSCLKDPGNYDRLQRCDEAAMRQVAKTLLTWPGTTRQGQPRSWLPSWTEEDIAKLLGLWKASRK